MKTCISMKWDEFEVELIENFGTDNFRCFFRDGDFVHCSERKYDGYCCEVKYKNTILTEQSGGRFGLKIGNFSLYERLEKNNLSFDFYDDLKLMNSIQIDTVAEVKVENKGTIENLEGDKKREEFISSICEKNKKQYEELYNKIADKGFFDFKFKLFIEFLYLEEECFNEVEKIKNFFEKYISLEKIYHYIKSNISVEKLENAYPQIKTFCLPEDYINEILGGKKEDFSLDTCGIFGEEYRWLEEEKNEEQELKKILEEIYLELHKDNEKYLLEQARKKLKNKYTVIYVLENNGKTVDQIENFDDMKFFLVRFLRTQCFSDEDQLKNEIKNFFERYKKHENEYKQFIEKVGRDYYVVEYDEQKEVRYHTGIYDEAEEFDVECMKKMISAFKDHAYVSGTTKFTPVFERIPFWTYYAKELIKTLLENEVIKENNGFFEFCEVENISRIDRGKLCYANWQKGESYFKYKKQRSEGKMKRHKDKIDVLSRLILSDPNFLGCKKKDSREKYLKNLLMKEYEEGREDYFYCLDSYRSRGFACLGDTAKAFIESLWITVTKNL